MERQRIRIVPHQLSNAYEGSGIALAFFVFLTALTLIRSLIHLLASDGGAQSIATIPLDTFSTQAAGSVVHIFALWGLSRLLIGVLYVVSLVRYRSMIPLLYLLAIVEYAVRLGLSFVKPITTEGTAPGVVGNYVLLPVLIVMFVLSLHRRSRRERTQADPDRYDRHRPLMTNAAWHRLRETRLLVAGAGGLGSTVISLLIRLGPVKIDIWDPGTVDTPDLNRQLLYTVTDIGEPKAGKALEQIAAVNPECSATVHQEKLTVDRFKMEYDDQIKSDSGQGLVLFDCVDSMESRAHFEQIQQENGVPVFHAAVEGWYGQVATITNADAGYGSFMPGGWQEQAPPPKPIWPYVVTSAASLQVAEFVKWLDGPNTPLSDALLHIDLDHVTYKRFTRGGGKA